jgi:DNA-binding response OmpR family regulator
MEDNQIFPVYDPAVRNGAPLLSQTNPLHRILVVEDDIGIRRLNTEMLKRSGYEVDAAEDGAAAWQSFKTHTYDLLITDNVMPKVTGVELLQKLRAARITLPVIMATGALPTAVFARHPWLQPAATLLKPYTSAELLRTVKKVLREADSTSDTPRQNPANSPQRILAVDEDSDLRRLYADALVGPSYRVDVAEDGAAGWEALQARNYHLLITEHDLPKLTGVELIRKLRAAHLALPVVMAAGRLPTHELAQNPSLQLAATLVKPFAVEALLDTVTNVLRATARPPS